MRWSDKQIRVALAVIILVHVAILVAEWISYYPVLIVSLNLTVSASLLLYWIQKQIRIQQHIIELREVVVLGLETVVAMLSVYSLIENPVKWLRISHVAFSVTHLLAVSAFFIFMLTFRVKRLF